MTETARPHILQTLFKIRPGEGRVVGLMFLYSLLAVGGTYVIGRTVSRSLFLSGLPPQAIPYRFLAMAIGVVLAASLYRRIVFRYRRDSLIMGSYAAMAVGALLFRLLLEAPFGDSFVVLGGMYVYFEVVAVLVIIQFWTFAAELFNPREAKRLFALIAAGATTANVLGGAILRVATPIIGTKNLIFLMVFCLLACVACVWFLRPIYQKARLAHASVSTKKSRPTQHTSLVDDARALGRVPLLLSVAAIIIITTLVFNIVDYQFDLSLKLAFGDNENQMSVFLSMFYFWGGMAACVVQFFLVNYILGRFGVVGALLVFPTAVLLGSLSILISAGALFAVSLTRIADVVFRYTINDTTLNLLYLPVPNEARARAKTMIDGILKPVTIAGAGILFLLFRGIEGMTIAFWSIPVLALVVVWAVLIFRARRQYMAALSANLKSRRIDLEVESIEIWDETTVHVLIDALEHGDEQQVLHVLSLIEEIPNIDWDVHVAPLLDRSEPEIRTAAIHYLGRPDNRAYLHPIEALFDDPEMSVRSAAVQAFCAIDGPQAVSRAIPFLQEPDPSLKAGAVIGLIRYGGLDGTLHAAEELKRMLESDRAAMRLEGARVLGVLQVASFYHPLIALFEDADVAVQKSALHATGELRAPELLPFTLDKLEQAATRATAADSLIRYGPGVEPVLGEALSEPGRSSAARAQLPMILQKIETLQAAEILLSHCHESDETVRTAIFRSLAKLRTRIEFTVDTETVQDAIMAEVGDAYALCVLSEDLGTEGRGVLLDDTLQVRRRRTIERVLYLLSLLHPDQARTIESVRWAMETRLGRSRAHAVELLDNLVDRNIRELLIPLVDAPVAQVLQIAQERFEIQRRSQNERLEELAHSPDAWLRACALFRIGELGLSELAPSIQDALEADQALVRETALGASRHVLSYDQFEQARKGQAADAPFLQVRNYAGELPAT